MNVTTPLRLVFNPTGELLEAARACEADVFLRTFGNTREELRDEYGPYEDASVFLALADPDDNVIAACRLIMPGASGLKTLNDASGSPWLVDGVRAGQAVGIDPSSAMDVATIGVRADAGNLRMFAAAALYHGVIAAARQNGLRTLVMIMDERARRLLTATGLHTHRLPGTNAEPYLGSPASTPVFAHVAEMVDGQRRINPDAYRLITLGVGMDGVTLPELEAFRLAERQPASALSAAHSEPASRA
ncbi:MAG TPA: hypothetical protein VEL02_04820 [Jatrophihabitantaceae bacterium]|nr:hypothetical protein [Jatrophihabitantaceae bacterium]